MFEPNNQSLDVSTQKSRRTTKVAGSYGCSPDRSNGFPYQTPRLEVVPVAN